MPVGYAVVGLGRFAQTHILPALQKTRESRLAALVSGDVHKLENLSQQHGGVNTYTYDNYKSALNDPDVDAVYIALPNNMHWQYTIDTANNGKHVLCEKPMATSAEQCLSMIETCRKNKVKLMIAYRVHFDPANLEAIRLIRDGAIGRPKFIQSAFSQRTTDPGQWRLNASLSGGGSLMDVGIYCINACRYLLGTEPESVVGMVSTTEETIEQVEENAMAIFRFPGRVLAAVSSSYGTERVDGFTIDGSDGWIRLEGAFSSHACRCLTMERHGQYERREFDSGDQVAAEIDYFSECIEANLQPAPDGEEGMKDIIAIDAVYRSARDGCCIPVNYQAVARAA